VTPRRSGLLVAVVVALAGVAVALGVALLFLRDDPAGSADSVDSADSAADTREPLEGFGEVAVTISGPGAGDESDFCLLLAETSEQRQRGLMEVTDPELGGYDGMLFRFDDEVEVGFWMMNTPMPLTVAYIGADGSLVSAADMEPCVGEDARAGGCPSYPPDGPYRWAVEVPQGGLDELGLVPGASFTDHGEPCD
jgi:uncharacterized membrane protein (UPF0127 family)